MKKNDFLLIIEINPLSYSLLVYGYTKTLQHITIANIPKPMLMQCDSL